MRGGNSPILDAESPFESPRDFLRSRVPFRLRKYYRYVTARLGADSLMPSHRPRPETATRGVATVPVIALIVATLVLVGVLAATTGERPGALAVVSTVAAPAVEQAPPGAVVVESAAVTFASTTEIFESAAVSSEGLATPTPVAIPEASPTPPPTATPLPLEPTPVATIAPAVPPTATAVVAVVEPTVVEPAALAAQAALQPQQAEVASAERAQDAETSGPESSDPTTEPENAAQSPDATQDQDQTAVVGDVTATPTPTPTATATPTGEATATPVATSTPEPSRAPANATVGELEIWIFNRLNEIRSDASLPPLTYSAEISVIARDWSGQMSRAGSISHRPPEDLSAKMPTGWQAWGENVAMAPDVNWAQIGLERSPGHYDNMIGSFSHVGIGVVVRGDTVFVTQNFGNY